MLSSEGGGRKQVASEGQHLPTTPSPRPLLNTDAPRDDDLIELCVDRTSWD